MEIRTRSGVKSETNSRNKREKLYAEKEKRVQFRQSFSTSGDALSQIPILWKWRATTKYIWKRMPMTNDHGFQPAFPSENHNIAPMNRMHQLDLRFTLTCLFVHRSPDVELFPDACSHVITRTIKV